ncbi:hypothetical protein QR680_005648 [Steinernema hermaphroditum]|uniref:Tubulin--tyrosine ligase-like protein 9 n=1 Tax=Steinernema hermaphroditum TaxID=289476 RepID=A0AA39HSW3_9BILA|nr:hypothetical protein QR680_005648 [Steinernema hermaphroditum]
MERQVPIPFKCGLANTICDVLNQRPGWTAAKGEEWLFNWVTREWIASAFDHFAFRERQIVCHFRNDFELTRKDCLIKNFKKARKAAKNPEDLDFLPPSYVLPAEYHLFVEEFKKYPPDTVWIMKPVSGAQGKGIFLFRKLKEITDWRRKDISAAAETQPYVVQKYVDSPDLIGGKKYDVRLYVLVTSFRPLNAWVHREGFARFSHSRYSMASVEDAYVHLTNVAIAKSAPDFDAERGLKWNLLKWKRYLAAVHGHEKTRKVMEDIGGIIMESLRFVNSTIIQNKHCFELFGYDILVDANLKPWLLEVNASPSLTASSQEDYEMKFRVLNHMLDILDLENRLSGQETKVGGFDLLLRNNEPVFTSATSDPSRKATFFTPSLNIRLGASIETLSSRN